MDNYYKWQIGFNKLTCEWTDLKSCVVAEQGTGNWTNDENIKFCLFIFHSDIPNDSTEPTLLNSFNYPNVPPIEYCSGMRFYKWRIIITETQVSEPFVIEILQESGDDLWRQITPFEYEVQNSYPIFCVDHPGVPNLANTRLKYDEEDNYRLFDMWWKCTDDGGIEHVKGPIYRGNATTAGDDLWKWDGEVRNNNLLGTHFILTWTSSVAGYGTAPVQTIDEDVEAEIKEYCSVAEVEEEIPNTDTTETVDNVEVEITGLPTFRVLYNCNSSSFETPQFIGLTTQNEMSAVSVNEWQYFDTFTQSGQIYCVYYYIDGTAVSADEQSDVDAISLPPVENISLLSCDCAQLGENIENINLIDIYDLLIEGVTGEASSVNGYYELEKVEENLWIGEEDRVDITMSFDSSNISFTVAVTITYNDKNKFTITKLIPISNIFVSDTKINFSINTQYNDANKRDICSLNVEGFTKFFEIIESSSESSSSDSSSSSLSSESSSDSSSQSQ